MQKLPKLQKRPQRAGCAAKRHRPHQTIEIEGLLAAMCFGGFVPSVLGFEEMQARRRVKDLPEGFSRPSGMTEEIGKTATDLLKKIV